jgi:hypothetical protein
MESEENTRKRIFDLAIEIRSGERDLPVDENTTHYEYAQEAADKAVRCACHSPSYDVPNSQTPDSCRSPPDGYDSFEDFSVDDNVSAVDPDGNIVDGEIVHVEDSGQRKKIEVNPDDNTADLFTLKGEDKLRFITDIQSQID